MNINQHIITSILLLTLSSILIGCASKLTEEQVIAESQTLSDGLKNFNLRYGSRIQQSNTIEFPATKRIGKTNQRLVLLSPKASLRWLGRLGFKFHIDDHGVYYSRKTPKSYSRGGHSRWKNAKLDDPQYIYFNNSRIMITGMAQWRDPQAGEEILYIYDQFDNVRVVTYEQY